MPQLDAETIVISANSCWNIVNFRGALVQALVDRGYRVVAAAPQDQHSAALQKIGASFVPVPINSSGCRWPRTCSCCRDI